MDTDKYKIEMLDYYFDSNEVLYRINIYNKKNNESWDIERSYDDFKQVDDLFQYRYPHIPRLPDKGWWWQKSKAFHENRFNSLKNYFNCVLRSDLNIENMVLAYFLDLNLTVSEASSGASNSIEEIEIDIIGYLRTRLLNISNANDRTLAPMERESREKQYRTLLENNQFFLEDCVDDKSEFALSNNESMGCIGNIYFEGIRGLPPSITTGGENKLHVNHSVGNGGIEGISQKDKEFERVFGKLFADDSDIVSLMNRICIEFGRFFESKVRSAWDMRDLVLHFQPIK
ncbi:hypothetical protein FG386_002761 [Cryptosporidium ryanae]|uniref:uncharacterized protein n=1 Tax=Cryptosporidium ryanae TaxID=515981 RepID=UPI00351A54EF|nr:hypothetical protein FG386_002761 [Cryptosporidium ryanae]